MCRRKVKFYLLFGSETIVASAMVHGSTAEAMSSGVDLFRQAIPVLGGRRIAGSLAGH
jgi:hypothetical protein